MGNAIWEMLDGGQWHATNLDLSKARLGVHFPLQIEGDDYTAHFDSEDSGLCQKVCTEEWRSLRRAGCQIATSEDGVPMQIWKAYGGGAALQNHFGDEVVVAHAIALLGQVASLSYIRHAAWAGMVNC